MAAAVPRILFLVLCAALLATPAAFAQQSYSQKPIRYIVPFSAGASPTQFGNPRHDAHRGCSAAHSHRRRGFTPMTPAKFADFVAAETTKWGKLIRAIGIRAD
jgi:tripartite-type tricarboxylate transporter receptor subunit TctC